MKSRFQAQSDFFERPSNHTYKVLEDVLKYNAIKGTMLQSQANQILTAARVFMTGKPEGLNVDEM